MSQDQISGIKKKVHDLALTHYPPLTVNRGELENTIDLIAERMPVSSSQLPEMMRAFFDIQIKHRIVTSFADMLYVMQLIADTPPEEHDAVCQLFTKRKLRGNDMDLSEFVTYLEGGHSSSHSPQHFSQLSYRFPQNDVCFIDEEHFDKERWLLLRYWRDCNQEKRAGWKRLFEIEVANDSFRDWLEARPFTEKIRDEFENLGLDYDAWDDPSLAFGYKRGRLEQIVFSGEDIRAETLEFAGRFMKGGDLTGYLTRKPGLVWKEIEPSYRRLERVDSDELGQIANELLEALSLSFKPQSLKKKNNKLSQEFRRLQELVDEQSVESLLDRHTLAYRVWRRQPHLDFYGGNDSGVCVAFNGNSGEAMINYFVDKSISIVDIVRRGKRRCGQIYMFAAYDSRKNPFLVLDSVEVSSSHGSMDKLENTLYESVEAVTNEIAKRTGFDRVFVSANLYWRYSAGFLDHLMHKYGRRHEHTDFNYGGQVTRVIHPDPEFTSFDTITINKIGGMQPIREAFGDIDYLDARYVGRMHYFDIFSIMGQEDHLDWKDNVFDYLAKGLLLEVL